MDSKLKSLSLELLFTKAVIGASLLIRTASIYAIIKHTPKAFRPNINGTYYVL